MIKELVIKQRAFFNTNQTHDVKFRIEALKKLKASVIKNEEKIMEALKRDLGRSECEAYFCDIGTVIMEINEALHDIKKWNRPKRLFSGLMCFPSQKTLVYRKPYGVVLIISPFNFPFILSLGVLVASISSGNTSIIKTSSKSKESSRVLNEIITEAFGEEYVKVINGGHDVADMLLGERFDKIFYTGSPKVACHVMEMASKNLTPVALELGGENGNWAIVRSDSDLKDAARKIAFFKACNSGQICININQVAVNKKVVKEFIELLKQEFIRQLGDDIVNNDEYSVLINDGAFSKCERTVTEYKEKVVFGGVGNKDTRRFFPTILYPIDINDEIVQSELFSPILPIVEYDDSEEEGLLKVINERERPLAFYVFTKDRKWAKRVMEVMNFGGGCINEVCLHFMVKGAPFNGVGHSGMGAYHGVWGFNEFTYPKTVLFGKTKGNLKLREHPYNKKKLNLIKKFEK